MSAPSIVIVLELEAAPLLLCNCVDESEERRLEDWLDAHPALLELAAKALELGGELETA
jgi:hypothetical protein